MLVLVPFVRFSFHLKRVAWVDLVEGAGSLAFAARSGFNVFILIFNLARMPKCVTPLLNGTFMG